jgi:hypothetical protein
MTDEELRIKIHNLKMEGKLPIGTDHVDFNKHKHMIDIIKEKKKVGLVDQTDLEKEYGFSWDEANEFCKDFENMEFMVSDGPDEYGFEEVVYHIPFENGYFKLTTVYGIGSFSDIEWIEE